jgi:hypothetical protein
MSNIWATPLDGGQPRWLTSFVDLRIFGFAWSRDGRTLAVSRGEYTSDVVLITDDAKAPAREKQSRPLFRECGEPVAWIHRSRRQQSSVMSGFPPEDECQSASCTVRRS